MMLDQAGFLQLLQIIYVTQIFCVQTRNIALHFYLNTQKSADIGMHQVAHNLFLTFMFVLVNSFSIFDLFSLNFAFAFESQPCLGSYIVGFIQGS